MRTQVKIGVDIIFTLFFFLATSAQAVVVTVDFEQSYGSSTSDYVENGFTFSPNCHYDFAPTLGYESSTYMAIDRDSCSGDGLYNGSFAGPSDYLIQPDTAFASIAAALYINFGGKSFSLMDFWSPVGSWTLESSSGGFYDSSSYQGETVTFSGSDWTNVDWLLFVAINDPGAPYIGIDHMRFSVPEPPVILLLLLGCVALLMIKFVGTRPVL